MAIEAEQARQSTWFVRYVSSLKGNCKWCDGDKEVTYTSGANKGQTVTCPRCEGSGDEPDCGDRLRKA